MINENRLVPLRTGIQQEYMESRGGDSAELRAQLVADALAWANEAGRELPKGWHVTNQSWTVRRNLDRILDGTHGVQGPLLDFWEDFLRAVKPTDVEPAPAGEPVGVDLTEAQLDWIAERVAERLARKLTG